jgi:site-specific recombinase XerC
VPILNHEIASAARFAAAATSSATLNAYRSDNRIFLEWCQEREVSSLPALPSTVAAFLAHEANRGCRPSTLGRRLAAIRNAHRLSGVEPPTDTENVKTTLRGIRRTFGTAQNRKAPATAEKARAMAKSVPDSLAGKRDRAILLLGFAGAFRRSELVALEVADLEPIPGGLRINIRRSKTDQEGQGKAIGIPFGSNDCPVEAVCTWLAAAGRPAREAFGQAPQREVGGQHRQKIREARRIGAQVLFGAFPALGLPDIRSGQRRFNLQDDGLVPAQIGRCLARLC